MSGFMSVPKRMLVGVPMRSDQLGETELPKRLALAVYCSDPISSNAYATQEILLVLALGGAAAVMATPRVALAVVGLLAVVTLSYRQTCHAYPNWGGAYACLLYTSDAADDLLCVDLGGRRIIKKK